jgi:hypothetical protein
MGTWPSKVLGMFASLIKHTELGWEVDVEVGGGGSVQVHG